MKNSIEKGNDTSFLAILYEPSLIVSVKTILA